LSLARICRFSRSRLSHCHSSAACARLILDWSRAAHPGKMNIFSRLDTPEGRALVKFVDPYEYRHRYADIPKFMVNSTGDQFFLPDSAQFYFHDLPGEKYLRYVPNTDHGLGRSDAVESLMVFFKSILRGSPRPEFTWSVKDDGSIEVKTTTKPTDVKLWRATNPKSRDFRLEIIGPAWKSSPLKEQAGGVYIASVPKPEKGWTAFMVELTFDSGGPIPYKFTTEVSVVPKTLPHADKVSLNSNVQFDRRLALKEPSPSR